MKHKLLLFINIAIISSICRGQSDSKVQLINAFYEKVYHSNISPEQIVRDYIVYSDTSGYKNAVNSIYDLRHPDSINMGEHFFSLKRDFLKKDYTLTPYNLFDGNEKQKFQFLSIENRNNVYRFRPKHTIQHYILVQDRKIYSFIGFQKSGDDSYIFIKY